MKSECLQVEGKAWKMMNLFVILFLCNLDDAQFSDISQPIPFQAVKLGDDVTLQCYIKSDVKMTRIWYQLTTGKRLQRRVKFDTFYQYSHYSSGRFSLGSNGTQNHLKISGTRPEDIGLYFCGVIIIDDIEFGSGTFLMIEGAELNRHWSLVQQPVSEVVQLGDSVTLNCTIHTETCAGEHSVYWFRHRTGDSHPEIIYSHGDRSGQCEKSPEPGSPTQSCVYHLPKRNLSLSDAGTYYCAVASCGEILFGNGTKLVIQGNGSLVDLDPAVLALIVSNTLFGMVTLLLVWRLCQIHRGVKTGNIDGLSSQHNKASEEMNYAAVSFVPRSSSPSSSSSRHPRVKANRETAVYSGVRYLQQGDTRSPSM